MHLLAEAQASGLLQAWRLFIFGQGVVVGLMALWSLLANLRRLRTLHSAYAKKLLFGSMCRLTALLLLTFYVLVRILDAYKTIPELTWRALVLQTAFTCAILAFGFFDRATNVIWDRGMFEELGLKGKGGGVDERAGLENQSSGDGTEGSNPSPSADV